MKFLNKKGPKQAESPGPSMKNGNIHHPATGQILKNSTDFTAFHIPSVNTELTSARSIAPGPSSVVT